MTPRTIVTVGAGQAAAVAARNLRRQGFDGRIMLIGDEPHAPYQRPPLSKEFLAGADSEAALWILRPSWIADNDVEIVTGTSVQRVDPGSRTVVLDSGADIDADAVLFATGGTPRTLPVPGPMIIRIGTSHAAPRRGRMTAIGAISNANECSHTTGTATIIDVTASANDRWSSPRQPSSAAAPTTARATIVQAMVGAHAAMKLPAANSASPL